MDVMFNFERRKEENGIWILYLPLIVSIYFVFVKTNRCWEAFEMIRHAFYDVHLIQIYLLMKEFFLFHLC